MFIYFLSAIVPGILALVFLEESLRMPRFGPFYSSPGFFPFIISIFLFILSFNLFLGHVRNMENTDVTRKRTLNKNWWIRTFVIVLSMVIYVFLLALRKSFIISTSLFLLVTIFYFEPKRIGTNLMIAFICSFGLYYLFAKLFFIPLP
jgi:hypothetical protein